MWTTLSERHGIPVDATVVFVFPGSVRREVCIADLLESASPGWLAGALPEAIGEEINVPEDTPLAGRRQARAFLLLLGLPKGGAASAQAVREAFCGQLRLVPNAFLAAHVLGLERAAGAVRGLFLQEPSAVLGGLRLQRDGAALGRALELGLARSTAPLRQGVTEQLEALHLALRAPEGFAGGALELAGGRWRPLLHLFRAAHELGAEELASQVRSELARPGALASLLRAVEGADMPALRFGLRHGLDRAAPAPVLHIAASQGRLDLVRAAVEEGQAVNARAGADGETPAMLAAAGGRLEVLRWLVRKRANLDLESHIGLTALDYAARSGQASAFRLLENPGLRLAVL